MRFLFLALFGLTLSAQAQFTPAPLPPSLSRYVDSERWKFGYITVPENRNNPASRNIQIAVVVVPSKSTPKAPDPVFFVVGGPGGSATDAAGGFPMLVALNQNRDVVYLDPRGAGLSEPNLYMRRDGVTIGQFTRANRTYFANQGIDVSAYNTTEIAKDFETARVALGYGTINLVANSYGTFVAQELVRNMGPNLRAVVMGGNSPATDSFIPTTLEVEKEGIDALLNDVQRSSAARKAYPNFRARFYKLLTSLQKNPRKLRIKNSDTNKMETVTLDSSEFTSTLSELLQRTETIRLLPMLVKELERGNNGSLTRRFFAPSKTSRRDNSYGMYLSVLGTDFAAPGYVKATERGILGVKKKELILAEGPGLYQLAQTIVSWGVPYNPGTTRTLPTSAVPTLFLNGLMDAQTPSSGGATIAAGFSTGINYIYPRIGHAVGFLPGPDMDAAVAFMNNPAVAPAYSTGTLLRKNFYKSRPSTARSRELDNWRDYLVDAPLSRVFGH